MNKMEHCLDIYAYIGKFLSNKDKIHFSMCSVKLDKLKYNYCYENPVNIKCISHLSYFDNFINVKISGHVIKIPSHATNLTIECLFNSRIIIPRSVTHLKLNEKINMEYENSSNITHMIFGRKFRYSIRGVIPLSVTHLKFDKKFNCTIMDNIPSSVTHLSFYSRFFNITERNLSHEEYIRQLIPPSVTHLTIYGPFKQIDSVPPTVTELLILPEC